jgi:hypothetical protein
MRYLTLLPSNGLLAAWQVAAEVLGTLSLCFVYGLGASVIDQYRSLLLNVGAQLRNLILPAENDASKKYIFKASAAFNSCVRHALRSFRVELDAGGPNDAFISLIEYSYQALTTKTLVFVF